MKFSNLEDDFGCLFFYIDIYFYSMVAIHAALVMNFDVNFDVARIRTIFLYFNILHPDPFGTVEQRVLARMRRSANHLFLISLSLSSLLHRLHAVQYFLNTSSLPTTVSIPCVL